MRKVRTILLRAAKENRSPNGMHYLGTQQVYQAWEVLGSAGPEPLLPGTQRSGGGETGGGTTSRRCILVVVKCGDL